MVHMTEARQVRREQLPDGAHDFDFLHGRYRVHNVRFTELRGRPDRPDTFESLSVAMPLPRDIGQIDELVVEGPAGHVCTNVRLYDRYRRRWNLYRVDGRSGMLQPQLQGAFSNGIGIFEGQDELDRQPVRIRQTWSHIDAASARCEQAYSRDNGITWEPNWIMHYTRVDDRSLSLATALMFSDPESVG